MTTPLRNYKLIAVAGLKNAGKTEASNMLLYLLNAPKPFQTYWWYKHLKRWPFKNKWKTTAFAKPLKQTLAIILNKPVEWFEDRHNKEYNYVDLSTFKVYESAKIPVECKLSENKFQKIVKNEETVPENYCISIRQLMQYYGTNVVRRFLGDKTWINATLNEQTDKNIIVSDLRFKVELTEVYKKGGTIIYIQRDSAKPGAHASEREVIEMNANHMFDYVVENNKSLSDLFYNLKQLL